MSPSSVDAEFQLLVSDPLTTDDHGLLIESILQFISEGLAINNNYELIQSYLCLILKVCHYYLFICLFIYLFICLFVQYHTAVLIKMESLLPLLYGLMERQKKGWRLLSNKMNYCNTLLSYSKSATV